MRTGKRFTPAEDRKIMELYPFVPKVSDICKVIKRTEVAIKTRAKKLGVKRIVHSSSFLTSSNKKVDRFIRKNYLGMTYKEIARKIKRSCMFVKTRVRQLGLVIPSEILEQRQKDVRFQKGSVPFTKGKKLHEFMSREGIRKSMATRFQKGLRPWNTKEKDGTITVRKNKGRHYKYIRISLGKWEPLHKILWEKKHGKIPKGKCIWFKNGNSLDCNLKNMELITRAEDLYRNRMNYLDAPPELREAIKLINKLKKKVKDHGKKQTVRLKRPSVLAA